LVLGNRKIISKLGLMNLDLLTSWPEFLDNLQIFKDSDKGNNWLENSDQFLEK